MSDSLSLAQLKAEQLARRTRTLALAQSFLILGLLSWLSVEYSMNTFMQEWLAQNFWPVGFLLNGTLVGVCVGVIAGWTIASYNGRRSREQAILDSLRKIV